MPLGTTFWAVILPVGKTNLCTNPSFELGTVGWGTLQAGTIGTTASFQTFGAWSGSIAPTSNGTAGAISPTWTAGNGTAYSISAYVRGQNGIPYRLAVGDSNGVNFVSGGTTTFTGGGTWHRYSLSYTESAGATRRVVLTKNSSADTGAIYVDGLQVEVGSITTYFDGDQEDSLWTAARHQSTSIRDGQSRAGGSVVALADLGLTVLEESGIGMPPLENVAQSFAQVPGAEFQRQRAGARAFTIASHIIGTTWRDFHNTRRTIINAFKIDAVTDPQPTRFWYIGGEGTVQIDAVLDGGLEGGNRSGFTELAGVRFVAHDPMWRNTTQEGTALVPRSAIGSTNYVAQRDALGRWGTMGVSGTAIQPFAGQPNPGPRKILIVPTGTIFVSGTFGTAGGTQAIGIAMWYPNTGAWGTLAGGAINNGIIRDMVYSPSGTLYVAGEFLSVAGTASPSVALWTGAWGTLNGGTITPQSNQGAWAIELNTAGTLFVGGIFDKAAGTTARFVAQWFNSAWGTLAGQTVGTINNFVRALTLGLDNQLYIGGDFGSAGGTPANQVAKWNGAFGTLSTGGDTSAVHALTPTLNGMVLAGGLFQTMGSGTARAIAQWNGAQWSGLGSGLQYNVNGGGEGRAIFVDPKTGDVYAGGIFLFAGGLPVPDSIARWNGYAWLPLDINFPSQGTVLAIAQSPSGTLYVGGNFSGTAQAANVSQVVNSGQAEAYPTFYARNTGSGNVRVYQLVNTLTGDGIYFNLSLLPNEEVTLDLTPGARTFQSSYAGNIFGKIIGGSNVATWRLLPGTNWVSLFADSDNLSASLYYRPRHWSADGTTAQ